MTDESATVAPLSRADRIATLKLARRIVAAVNEDEPMPAPFDIDFSHVHLDQLDAIEMALLQLCQLVIYLDENTETV